MQSPGIGVICVVASLGWPLLLDLIWGNVKVIYIRVSMAFLVAIVVGLAIAYPYLVLEYSGNMPLGNLETRWLGYFLVAGFVMQEIFARFGRSKSKRVLCVLLAAVVGFFVLLRGISIV